MSATPNFRNSIAIWSLAGLSAVAVMLSASAGLAVLLDAWLTRAEYSHGVLVPLLTGLMAWQRRDLIMREPFNGSWSGLLLVVVAVALLLVGHLSTVFVLQQYAVVIAIYGTVLALTGWRVFRILWPALLMLIFMVPLPAFLMSGLSAELQLLSSQLGVLFLRVFGISVLLEGNVIDLGGYKLEVAEACSGLRYLFPLMTIGFMMAYLYRAPLWKRSCLFLSTIPITILMNSLRIAIIGVTVEFWGIHMAEGFLHDFEGWVVFMASMAVLIGEIVLLTKLSKTKHSWREVFGFEWTNSSVERSGKSSAATTASQRNLPLPFAVSTAMLCVFAITMLSLPQRAEVVPERHELAEFPKQLSIWSGHRESLDSIYVDALKLDDYLLSNFVRADGSLVNFYIAWYNSQRAGQSAHSPRSCLPGGGWRINAITQVVVPNVIVNGVPLRTNRVEIELGQQRQLVYYWFQQRGRLITNEYLVKWYLFWDSLTRQRSDGALVRLVTPLSKDEDMAAADARLAKFSLDASSQLDRYIPR